MYNVRLLDQNRRRIAVIEAPASWRYTRRPSEATDLSLSLPREHVETGLPVGVDLYAFLAPYQVAHVGHVAGAASPEPKYRRGDIGRYVEIYRGTQHVVTGRILKVDITDETIAFQCLTEEIELERYVTPAQYGRVWDGWDLADVARDLLSGWYVQRVKDRTQWEEAIEAVNVDTTTEPGVVMLAKSGGRYVASGHITVRFKRDGVPDFLRWDRIRWASDNAAPVRTTMQYRYGNGSTMSAWSDEVEGALPDEIGVMPGADDAEVIDVRINLYTDDRDTEDGEGNPVGQTPYVFAVEMVARTVGTLQEGDIPAVAGVKVSGLEADGVSAFNVLSQACAQTGWEFWVSDGRLFLASEMGQDRTSSVLLRAGTNVTVKVLSTGDDELVNIVTAYGPGSGINRLVTVRRHEESIARYGPHPGRQEFPEASTIDDLIQAADGYLAEHAAPIPAYQVEVHYPYGTEPDFGCGDYVRVVDPRNGIITTSRIAEEQRDCTTSGLRTTLFLGVPAPSLARQVRPTPPPREVTPPARPEISVSPIAGGIRVVDTRAPKTKWLTTECHVSDEPNFERTAETLVENARKSRFDVLGLTPGVRYYVQLVRIDPAGNESVSEVRSAVAGDIPEPTPDLTPPAKPTGLVAIPVVGGFVLTWDHHSPPPPLDRWVLQRASSKDDYATWQTVNDEIRSAFYTDVDALSYDYQYKYRLIAVSRAGIESLPSDETAPNTPGKVSLASQVIGRLARGQLAEEIIAELDGIVQIQEDLEDLSGDVSSVVQTAQQLSQAVAQVEDGLIKAQSEIQQNADNIALRLQGVRRKDIVKARFGQLPSVNDVTLQAGLTLDNDPVDFEDLLDGKAPAYVEVVVRRGEVPGGWDDTSGPLSLTGSIWGLVRGASEYLAYGVSNVYTYTTAELHTSPDGKVWTNITEDANFDVPMHDIVYSQKYGYVGLGELAGDFTVTRSTDGVNWSTKWFAYGEELYSIACDPGTDLLVVVGYDWYANQSLCLWSDDGGLTWHWSNLNDTVVLSGVTHGDAGFVAVGDYGAVWRSADGKNWTKVAPFTSGGFRRVSWTGLEYVALTFSEGMYATSPDGLNWTMRYLGVDVPILSAVGIGDLRIIGAGTSLFYSYDGQTWEEYIAAPYGFYRGAAASETEAVMVADNGQVMRYVLPQQVEVTYEVGQVVSYTSNTLTLDQPWTEENIPGNLATDHFVVWYYEPQTNAQIVASQVDEQGFLLFQASKILMEGSVGVRELSTLGGGTTVDELGLRLRENGLEMVRVGNVGGLPWGEGQTLSTGTYGLWGEKGTGVYLRGYARLLEWGYKWDEDIIDLRDYPNLANPSILVAPKEMLTYSPQQPTAVPHLYTETIEEEPGLFRVKAKTVVQGAETPLPTTTTSGDRRNGYWQQPQTAGPGGAKGVQTNFFKCRVNWSASGGYIIRVYQYVTNQFDANGDPINWERKRSFSHQGPLFATHSGTLNWDISLPDGVWAIRVAWESTNPVLVTYAWAEMASGGAAYRSDVYLDNTGQAINPDDPSGMSVMYIAYDQG